MIPYPVYQALHVLRSSKISHTAIQLSTSPQCQVTNLGLTTPRTMTRHLWHITGSSKLSSTHTPGGLCWGIRTSQIIPRTTTFPGWAQVPLLITLKMLMFAQVAKFFILCDVIFLMRLQGEFEIDHSAVKGLRRIYATDTVCYLII